jgi:hypothetical protein
VWLYYFWSWEDQKIWYNTYIKNFAILENILWGHMSHADKNEKWNTNFQDQNSILQYKSNKTNTKTKFWTQIILSNGTPHSCTLSGDYVYAQEFNHLGSQLLHPYPKFEEHNSTPQPTRLELCRHWVHGIVHVADSLGILDSGARMELLWDWVHSLCCLVDDLMPQAPTMRPIQGDICHKSGKFPFSLYCIANVIYSSLIW